MKKHIKEIIVVEGKDDVSAVRRAVDATILTTSGMGLAHLDEIAALGKRQGAIILTDPDVPGTRIRQRVTELLPNAKHAFIARKDACHPVTGKAGVEYAAPETILRALEKHGRDKSVILVSHRLSTLSAADRIYKLEGGVAHEQKKPC